MLQLMRSWMVEDTRLRFGEPTARDLSAELELAGEPVDLEGIAKRIRTCDPSDGLLELVSSTVRRGYAVGAPPLQSAKCEVWAGLRPSCGGGATPKCTMKARAAVQEQSRRAARQLWRNAVRGPECAGQTVRTPSSTSEAASLARAATSSEVPCAGLGDSTVDLRYTLYVGPTVPSHAKLKVSGSSRRAVQTSRGCLGHL